jgi:hypothetical protein
MPRKAAHDETPSEKRGKPAKPRPLSPEQLEWCDPNHELEAEPEPGDFDFEPDWDGE